MDMENGEGERDIYCTWEKIMTKGLVWTRRGRFSFALEMVSSITECLSQKWCFVHGVFIMELTRWGWSRWNVRGGGEREVRKGKVLLKILGEKWKWNKEFATVISTTRLWFDNALIRGPRSHSIYHICH